MNSSSRLTPETIASLLQDTEPYLSCDDCFTQIDTYVERTVADPTYTDPPMQTHLAACAACAEEARTLAELLAH
jgi:hypothetical protein